jgi:translocation and assembly module TamB
VNNYLVDGVGLFDVTTDSTCEPRRRLRPARPGRGANPPDRQCTDRGLLGGPAPSPRNLAVESSGWSGSTMIRLASPCSGSARARHLSAERNDRSALHRCQPTYGPIRPRHRHADAPQIGSTRPVPASASASRRRREVRATAQGWAIRATGESAYGPFSADVIILSIVAR